jgi:hypothetical protein
MHLRTSRSAIAALLALSPAVLAGCAHNTVTVTSPYPYELWVFFRPDTGSALATQVLQRCGREPAVVRIGKVITFRGQLRGSLYTKEMKSRATQPLLRCLTAASVVQYAAWPD